MASDEKIARAMTLMRRWCSCSALRSGRPSSSRLMTEYMEAPTVRAYSVVCTLPSVANSRTQARPARLAS
jgi:hypothetical protein